MANAVDREGFGMIVNREQLRAGDGAQVFLDAPIVGEGVHRLDQPLRSQPLQELSVGNGAACRADSAFQRKGVVSIFDRAQKLPVVDERQDHGSGFPVSIGNAPGTFWRVAAVGGC